VPKTGHHVQIGVHYVGAQKPLLGAHGDRGTIQGGYTVHAQESQNKRDLTEGAKSHRGTIVTLTYHETKQLQILSRENSNSL
jgi:hypothetical protein